MDVSGKAKNHVSEMESFNHGRVGWILLYKYPYKLTPYDFYAGIYILDQNNCIFKAALICFMLASSRFQYPGLCLFWQPASL